MPNAEFVSMTGTEHYPKTPIEVQNMFVDREEFPYTQMLGRLFLKFADPQTITGGLWITPPTLAYETQEVYGRFTNPDGRRNTLVMNWYLPNKTPRSTYRHRDGIVVPERARAISVELYTYSPNFSSPDSNHAVGRRIGAINLHEGYTETGEFLLELDRTGIEVVRRYKDLAQREVDTSLTTLNIGALQFALAYDNARSAVDAQLGIQTRNTYNEPVSLDFMTL